MVDICPQEFGRFLAMLGHVNEPVNVSAETYRTGSVVVCYGGHAFKFLPSELAIEERRRQFEVEVAHQALVPDSCRIAIDLVSVVKGNDGLELVIGNFAGAVEYALLMRRLEATEDFRRCLSVGRINTVIVTQFATDLFNFHQRCVRASKNQVKSALAQEARNEIEDTAEARRLLYGYASQLGIDLEGFVERLSLVSQEYHRTAHERTLCLASRGQRGYVRDIHGDLHAENWWLVNRRIVFPDVMPRDKYRVVDVQRDIARVIVEFIYLSRQDLATCFEQACRDLWGGAFSDLLLRYFCLRSSVADLKTHLTHFEHRRAAFADHRLRNALVGLERLCTVVHLPMGAEVGPKRSGKTASSNDE